MSRFLVWILDTSKLYQVVNTLTYNVKNFSKLFFYKDNYSTVKQ